MTPVLLRQRLHEFTHEQLIDVICDQVVQIETLKAEIARLKKDGSTSSKPPYHRSEAEPHPVLAATKRQIIRRPAGAPRNHAPAGGQSRRHDFLPAAPVRALQHGFN